LLLGLRARDVSSRRDGSKIFLQITPLNTLRDSTLNTTVHALISCNFLVVSYSSLYILLNIHLLLGPLSLCPRDLGKASELTTSDCSGRPGPADGSNKPPTSELLKPDLVWMPLRTPRSLGRCASDTSWLTASFGSDFFMYTALYEGEFHFSLPLSCATYFSPFASTASISASSLDALRRRFAWVHKRLGSLVRRRPHRVVPREEAMAHDHRLRVGR
jgi:hypothetical protein